MGLPLWYLAAMPLLHIVVLAIVQGITEFLPISSSAHLVLVPVVFGWPDQGLLLDIAVHIGTLLAVMVYFWRDLFAMVAGVYDLARGNTTAGARLAIKVAVATVPLVLAGFVLYSTHLTEHLRSIEVIAWATIGFGLVLWIADRLGMTMRRLEHLGYGGALFIGLSQALALIPGTSRSGITMTAARILGMERSEAARFSMLLSMPAIAAAGMLATLDLVEAGNATLQADALIAAGIAFATALLAITLMMAWLRRASFGPFVLYRLLLGGALLAYVHWWA
ncbi:MAG: undecaprenyl-diphosphate phosphatase [Acetobacterales bacterium]